MLQLFFLSQVIFIFPLFQLIEFQLIEFDRTTLFTCRKQKENIYMYVAVIFFISGNFYFSFVSTSLAYIAIPPNKTREIA